MKKSREPVDVEVAPVDASGAVLSIFQFRYEPEGTGVRIVSAGRLIGLKGEV
jgi:hypothetical protein